MKTLMSFKMFWIHKLLLYTELFSAISFYKQKERMKEQITMVQNMKGWHF